MAGINWKRLGITLFALLLFSYFTLLLPQHKGHEYLPLLDLQFLNFNQFETYSFLKFDPPRIFFFIAFFGYIYFEMAKNININTSFMSMILHKQTKKDTVVVIIKEMIKDSFMLFVLLCCSVTIIGLLDGWIQQGMIINLEDLLAILIYLFEMAIILCGICGTIRLCTLRSDNRYALLIPIIIIIGFMVIDMIFGTHFITLTRILSEQLLNFGIVVIILMSFILLESFRFIKGKEVLQDD